MKIIQLGFTNHFSYESRLFKVLNEVYFIIQENLRKK
jgi:hypothetical protein